MIPQAGASREKNRSATGADVTQPRGAPWDTKSHANTLRFCIKSREKPRGNPAQRPHWKDIKILLLDLSRPLFWGRERCVRGSGCPKVGVLRHPLGHQHWPKCSRRWSWGLRLPGNFYLPYFSPGLKSFFLCPELYLKLSSMFQ